MDLRLFDTQALGHLLIEEPLARAVGLHPLAVNDELRDGAFAGTSDDFVGRARSGFNINILEWDVITLQEALGYATVRAPEDRIKYENFFASFARFSLCPLR